MITENRLLSCWSLLIILLHFLQTSHANHSCSPSHCGIISNISHPFRLKDDPKNCGDPKYELACENNVTFIYLNSQKYLVKAVNYGNSTIRLADPSINDDTCSFPKHSTYAYNFNGEYPFSTNSEWIFRDENDPSVAWPINFLSCPYRLEDLNSSNFTEITDCANGENSFGASSSSRGRYTYIKVGHMSASDVGDKCSVDLIVMTSWKFKSFKNVTLSNIHDALLYGFELSWFQFRCIECNGGWECTTIEARLDGCSDNTFQLKLDLNWGQSRVLFARLFWLVLLLLLVIGFRLEVLIITGFTCVWGLLILSNSGWFFDSVNGVFIKLILIVVISYAAKIIIAYPCVMGLLVYKFRRRHLSMFDDIEGFLQSDNELVPIRYTYSDLKKMTRGFREKLGEGGYGAVYKAKLQSGHDVAVKLRGKAGANSQDFFNEISTIGRIHHVNIVKLVGYCAERSKRALIFDFMPNGSLEKYIFGREKMNSLNWDRKFEIAVGVARGIEYLHRGCDIQILHFDIKPHNILLDDKFIPKISDFGLAKFYSTEKKTVTLSAARGTIGYVAPELISRSIGAVSYKADVYSFGMLLMEMAGLKRDLTGSAQNSSQYFPSWIYDCYNQGKDIEFGNGDEIKDEDNERVKKTIKKMTIVALWCIQMSPDDRPPMNKVVEMLEGDVERLRLPDRPSESIQVAVNEDQTSSYTTTSSTDNVSLHRGSYPSSSLGISVQDSSSSTR